MSGRWTGLVHDGMDVLDVDGDKVGRVEDVFQSEDRRAAAPPDATAGPATAAQLFMRVATGFLGLGHRVYIPESAIRDIQSDCVLLTVDKDDIDRLGWGRQPSHATEQHYGADVPTASAATTAAPAIGDADKPSGSIEPTRAAPQSPVVHTLGPDENERTLELRAEELTANTEMVQTGEVEIRKRLVTETRTIEVPVTREEVVVERHATNRPADDTEAAHLAPADASADVIRIPVVEEEVIVQKRPVVKEEIEVSKHRTNETRRVSGTVRREELVVDRDKLSGDVNVRQEEADAPEQNPG